MIFHVLTLYREGAAVIRASECNKVTDLVMLWHVFRLHRDTATKHCAPYGSLCTHGLVRRDVLLHNLLVAVRAVDHSVLTRVNVWFEVLAFGNERALFVGAFNLDVFTVIFVLFDLCSSGPRRALFGVTFDRYFAD